jgi:hypothetical protein
MLAVSGGPTMTEAEWLACTRPDKMLEFLHGPGHDRKLRLFAVAACRRVWHVFVDVRSRAAVEVGERYADGEAAAAELEAASDAAWDVKGEGLRVEDELRDRDAPPSERKPLEVRLWGTEAAAWPAAADIDRAARGSSLVVQGIASREVEAGYYRQICEETGVAGEFDEDEDIMCPDPEVSRAAFDRLRERAERERTELRERAQAAEVREQHVQCDLLRDIFGNPFRPVTLSPSWLTIAVVAIARQMYDSRDFSPMPILADALQDAGCKNADILAHCRGDGPHARGCWVVDLLLGKG